MKGKNRIIYLCAVLFALTVIGGLLHASPALAWDTWPAAANNDPNHTWTVVFDQAMNTATINSENIYVSNDITGSSRVSGISVSASDNTHASVAPSTGGWNTDTNYYLIITQKVLTSAGAPLKDEVRMPFRIVTITRETPTIDVINDGSNITVKVNGNQLSCDQPPYIANGRTMVPFRTIAEALGAKVDWDQASQKITIMGDKTVELTVNSTTARVNGASVTLDNPAVITGGRTMVPLRFVGESLGAKVNYTSLHKPDSSQSGDQFEYGNTSGNILNGGIAAQKGMWIYYNGEHDYLYKIRTDGSERTQLIDEFILGINVTDDWVYYVNHNDWCCLYKIRTDGSNRTKLYDHSVSCVNVVGGWIYFANGYDDGKLYKMKNDGSSLTKLNDEYSYNIIATDDWIYYNNGGRIYKIRTDGSGKIMLNDERVGIISIIDDWIYYGDGTKLCKMRIDGSNKVTLIDNEDYCYCAIADNWFLFANRSDHYRFYKIRIDGSNKTFINDDVPELINVVGDWIYYKNNNENKFYRIKIDGSNRELVY